jgi:hypothetical protein
MNFKNSLQLLNRALVMPLALSSSVALAQANTEGESIPSDESQNISRVVEMIQSGVVDGYQTNGHAYRDAHRKTHGCVKAQFQVLDNLSPELSQGIFSNNKTYQAWIRFSNGDGHQQDDNKGDGRGMAVKLMGVEGERLLTDDHEEQHTQDFIMINSPVFFVKNVHDYVTFQKAAGDGVLSVFWWITTHFNEGGSNLAHFFLTRVKNPLDIKYYSMVPYKMGPHQMKYAAKPCADSKFTNVSVGPDKLGENLAATLAQGPACFDFKVQLRTDPDQMPIEDPTQDWDQDISPYVNVAKITIAQQSPVMGEFCETLSYSPWNSLSEHRPLGGISRARKAIYQAISRIRHALNGQVRAEPSALESP